MAKPVNVFAMSGTLQNIVEYFFDRFHKFMNIMIKLCNPWFKMKKKKWKMDIIH